MYRWLSDDEYAASYLILTQSQHIASQELGSLPKNFIVDLEDSLRADDRFEVLIEADTAVVFVAAS